MSTEKSVNDRLHELAKKSLERTLAGQISWRTTDDEEAFLFAGAKSSLIVDKWRDSDGDLSYVLRLLNPRGTLVESLQTAYVGEPTRADDPWAGKTFEPARWNETLELLYDAARRSALDIDAVLDAALNDLDIEEPPF
ncbi:hypothetical protein AB0I34_39990 [Kribbella sp. NPDC050281]|uniref:hypothetical protein n=1 Tax=Kribbella sp. NPDC050281 TaxID=3155515 RepID=UPI0033E9EB99